VEVLHGQGLSWAMHGQQRAVAVRIEAKVSLLKQKMEGGAAGRGDVGPVRMGLAGRVDDHEIVSLNDFWKAPQPFKLVGTKAIMRPGKDGRGFFPDVAVVMVIKVKRALVMIAAHGLDAAVAQKVDAFAWRGAVADDVAGADDFVNRHAVQDIQSRGQSVDIGMDVSKNCDEHNCGKAFVQCC